MRYCWLALLVVCAVACSKKSEPAPAPAAGSGSSASAGADKPHHHEDRHDPQAAPTKLAVTVTIAGKPTVTWGAEDFAKVAKMPGTATDGEARDTWSLRELAHQLVGPTARVTAVVGEGGAKVAIDEAKWNAADSTPILHSTRRGTLKFRYADKTGAWGDTIAKEVTGLDVQP